MAKFLFNKEISYKKDPPNYTGKLLEKAKWMVKYLMDSGVFDQFHAIAAVAARHGSNGSLDPNIVGHNKNKSIDCGVWQWNDEAYIPGLRKYGLLPDDFPTTRSKIEEYFNNGKLSFEDQVRINVSYIKKHRWGKKWDDQFSELKKICGNDIEKATICIAGLISYTDIRHVINVSGDAKQQNYMDKGAAGAALYKALLGQTLPDVGDTSDIEGNVDINTSPSSNNFASTFVSSTPAPTQIATMSSNIENVANTLYQIGSDSERDDVLTLAADRKETFKSMREKLRENSLGMGRPIIESSEMYNSSILKSGQSAKQFRPGKRPSSSGGQINPISNDAKYASN